MPVETLENLRLLSNLETSTDKLLQIVLCGQPELEEHLGQKGTSPAETTDRGACGHLPLSRKESLEYIRHRLSKASKRKTDIFSAAALARIVSKGRRKSQVDQHPVRQRLDHRVRVPGKADQFRTAREIIEDLEEQSFLMNHWKVGIAGISILFLLTTGYWVYGTKIAGPVVRVESPESDVPVPREPVGTRHSSGLKEERGKTVDTRVAPPVAVRTESHDIPAAVEHRGERVPTGSQEKINETADTSADIPVVARTEPPGSESAGKDIVEKASGGIQEEEKSSVGGGGRKKVKPVARTQRKREVPSPLQEDILEISDQVVLKREKQQTQVREE